MRIERAAQGLSVGADVPSAVCPAKDDVARLRARLPTDHGLTVFDAETQDTSYGILTVAGVPLIFDTHRKTGRFVSTAELLTEVVRPVSVAPAAIERFSRIAPRHGLIPIPYTSCFFKGNLHVYAFHGPVRGMDVAAIGSSVAQAEKNLAGAVASLWPAIPSPVRGAQIDLLRGRRKARYEADLEVLRRRLRGA